MSNPTRSLQLVDGSCWTFHPSDDRSEWLDSFADVLSLPRGHGTLSSHGWDIHIVSKAELYNRLRSDDVDVDQIRTFNIGPLRVHSIPGSRTLFYEVPDNSNRKDWLMSMWYGQYALYPALLQEGNCPIHAGLAVYHGKGVLFAAPGGTGKSTTISRLSEDWEAVCDDECWLVRTKEGLFAHPMPTWSDLVLRGVDRTWPTSCAIPVESIVFLQQSKTTQLQNLNHAETTNFTKQAAEQILRRAWTSLPPPDMNQVRKRVFELSDSFAQSMHGFLLHLNLTDPFWAKLESALDQRES
jgi:SynChlorMet cassette protein ScmC